jgi:lycopene cyclase domain-containing protein
VNYTVAAVLGVLVGAGLDVLAFRTNLLRRKAFWTAYAIVLFFQLIVNGLLTGLRIVRYRPSAILGWRIVYAPVEDVLFGFALVLITLSLWVWAGRRSARSTRRAARSARSSLDAPGPPAPGG